MSNNQSLSNKISVEELLEKYKDKIIAEVFNNDNVSLEEKKYFTDNLEYFAKNWQELVFDNELEERKVLKINDELLTKFERNIIS